MFFFFFQAEDGIRDRNVTGVQTCALPISTTDKRRSQFLGAQVGVSTTVAHNAIQAGFFGFAQHDDEVFGLLFNDGSNPNRSEERRVGKECRSRWWAYH